MSTMGQIERRPQKEYSFLAGSICVSIGVQLNRWAVTLLWCRRAAFEGVEGKRKNEQKEVRNAGRII